MSELPTSYVELRDKIAETYGGTWGECTNHPVEDWQYEVANDDTRLGYWDCVMSQLGIGAED